jgi:hypothetical protein
MRPLSLRSVFAISINFAAGSAGIGVRLASFREQGFVILGAAGGRSSRPQPHRALDETAPDIHVLILINTVKLQHWLRSIHADTNGNIHWTFRPISLTSTAPSKR